MVPDLHNMLTVSQYPAIYLDSDISADVPGGSQGQNNTKMYIMNSFVADFSTLPNPDEFDEDFGSGYSHYAANPALGASYASYIRDNAVLGYPLTDSEHAAIVQEEKQSENLSAFHILPSQHGTEQRQAHTPHPRIKCRDYVERDATTGETYSTGVCPRKRKST